MDILVTGASGLLGRTVALHLAARGDRVTVLQRRPSGLGLREVTADIGDAEAVRHATAGAEAVVHLAAKVDVVGDWESFYAANVNGTRNVLDAADTSDVGRVVHVSSPSVAHAGASLVAAPAGPANPRTARGNYSRSKAIAELMVLDPTRVGPPAVVIRPHLVWGPGDTQLVQRIVDRGRTGRLALVGSGSALIDTTYVDDAASAIVAALDRAPEIAGCRFVVSGGMPRPVADILTAICAAAGVRGPRLRIPYPVAWGVGALVDTYWSRTRRVGDPPITRFLAEQLATAHWFDQRETRQALRWMPTVGLDEGLRRLTDYYAAADTVTTSATRGLRH